MATLNMIADEIAAEFKLGKAMARDIAKEIFDRIVEHVAGGDPVNVAGIGTFQRKLQQEMRIRNPQTNEPMTVPQKWKMQWRASPLLGPRLNEMIVLHRGRRTG